MRRIARKIRAFHEEGYRTAGLEQYEYDPIWQCERLFTEASKAKGNLFKNWMIFFYKQARKLGYWCLPQYEKMYGELDSP